MTNTEHFYDIDNDATYVTAFEVYDEDQLPGCECELDWNCGWHRGGPTAIEKLNDEWASRESDPYDY